MTLLKTLALSALTCITLSACSTEAISANKSASKNVSQDDKPLNVVLVLIDDLSHYGVTAYGADRLHSYDGEFTNKKFATPNIDALAKEGLRADYAYAYPICENTRIAFMSGKRNDRNYLRPKAQHRSDITFGDAFKKAGYATGLYGKWKQTRGSKEVPGKDYIAEFGWDDYAAFDVITEGQRFINPNLVINGEVLNYNGRTDFDPATGRRWYGPDIVNRHALKFIENNKDKPFFLYYPMILVHDDHKPTPDTKPNSIFDNFSEKAQYNNKGGDDREYFPDMIEYMDKLIGNVVKKLEEEGVRDNTLVVVMGDNATKEAFGHVMPDGTIYPGRKGGNADNGIHVPLVLNYPAGIPSSENDTYRTYEGLVNLTDIYPTIAEAAGIPLPDSKNVDGISFWQQAIGTSENTHRDYIYTWFIGNDTYKTDDVLSYAFTKDFKRYAPDADFPDGRFFDLRTDLLERKGKRVVKKKWGILRYSGLEISELNAEQRQGYDYLGALLKDHKITNVTDLHITPLNNYMFSQGETHQLKVQAFPAHAQRQGVIWHSSNPNVATVSKFGELETHNAGEALISIYSWDDAEPLSANKPETFSKSGVSDSISIKVLP